MRSRTGRLAPLKMLAAGIEVVTASAATATKLMMAFRAVMTLLPWTWLERRERR